MAVINTKDIQHSKYANNEERGYHICRFCNNLKHCLQKYFVWVISTVVSICRLLYGILILNTPPKVEILTSKDNEIYISTETDNCLRLSIKLYLPLCVRISSISSKPWYGFTMNARINQGGNSLSVSDASTQINTGLQPLSTSGESLGSQANMPTNLLFPDKSIQVKDLHGPKEDRSILNTSINDLLVNHPLKSIQQMSEMNNHKYSLENETTVNAENVEQQINYRETTTVIVTKRLWDKENMKTFTQQNIGDRSTTNIAIQKNSDEINTSINYEAFDIKQTTNKGFVISIKSGGYSGKDRQEKNDGDESTAYITEEISRLIRTVAKEQSLSGESFRTLVVELKDNPDSIAIDRYLDFFFDQLNKCQAVILGCDIYDIRASRSKNVVEGQTNENTLIEFRINFHNSDEMEAIVIIRDCQRNNDPPSIKTDGTSAAQCPADNKRDTVVETQNVTTFLSRQESEEVQKPIKKSNDLLNKENFMYSERRKSRYSIPRRHSDPCIRSSNIKTLLRSLRIDNDSLEFEIRMQTYEYFGSKQYNLRTSVFWRTLHPLVEDKERPLNEDM